MCACAHVSPICLFTNIRVTVMLSCGFKNPLALPWQHLNLHFISDYCMCGLDQHSAGLRTHLLEAHLTHCFVYVLFSFCVYGLRSFRQIYLKVTVSLFSFQIDQFIINSLYYYFCFKILLEYFMSLLCIICNIFYYMGGFYSLMFFIMSFQIHVVISSNNLAVFIVQR